MAANRLDPVAGIFNGAGPDTEGADETPYLRPAEPDDLGSVYAMRNLLEIVRWTESGREVTMDEHRTWFARRIAKGDSRLFLIEVEGTPAGVLDLARRDEEAVISIYLLSPLRGRGHGRRLIGEACAVARQCWGRVTVVARILSDNTASLHAFRAAGFVEAANEGRVMIMKLAPGGRDRR
jgi:UDP-4-amino-4,6-dideoxy-N-acetyl-beta-L-altrosamine N-acetyltransferase